MMFQIKEPYRNNISKKEAKSLAAILNRCHNLPLRRFEAIPSSYRSDIYQVVELRLPEWMTLQRWNEIMKSQPSDSELVILNVEESLPIGRFV